MSKITKTVFLTLSLVFSGCIGTDYIDDLEVGAMLEINAPNESLMIGDDMQLTYQYSDNFGRDADVEVVWITSSDNVRIDENGLLTAISKGQADIYAKYEAVRSPLKRITVVGSAEDVASINILYTTLSMEVGQTQQFGAEVKNFSGMVLTNKDVTWESSEPGIISIDEGGLLTANANGIVEITAISEGVFSSPVMMEVGQVPRTGEFVPNGYTAEGSALLSYNEDDALILTLSSDFKTSFALGTFIYLSNSKEGGVTKSSGLELAEIFDNGGREFNVSAINASVDIDTYDYVIILCKPAALTFGYAELKP